LTIFISWLFRLFAIVLKAFRFVEEEVEYDEVEKLLLDSFGSN